MCLGINIIVVLLIYSYAGDYIHDFFFKNL